MSRIALLILTLGVLLPQGSYAQDTVLDDAIDEATTGRAQATEDAPGGEDVEAVDDADEEASPEDAASDEAANDAPVSQQTKTPALPVETTDLPARDFDPAFDSTLKTKSREELEDEGFVFSDASKLASSSTATVIALTAGSVIHGLGHIYAGDTRTGAALLYAETLGVVSMIGAGVFMIADGGAGTLTGIAAPLFQLGFGTFMISWFLDIIGSVQGDLLAMPRSTANSEGIQLEVTYGFLSSPSTPTRHALRAALDFDFGEFWVRAGTVQDVLLSAGWYQAETGIRILRVRPQTFLSLSAASDYYHVNTDGEFQRLGVEARIGGSVDLGHFFSRFNDVAVGLRVGYGNHWFNFDPEMTFTDFESRNAYVSYRGFFNFNVSEKLNVEYGYGSHPGALITGGARLPGVSDLWFDYRTNFGTFRLGAELGDGVALWIGGGLGL